MPTSPRSVTSAQGLQALPGVAVQLLHAGRPGGREEDVSLLVPRCTVVHAQLALDVQVGDSCKTKEENRALSIGSFQLCIWQTLGRDGVESGWSGVEIQTAAFTRGPCLRLEKGLKFTIQIG